VLLIRQLPSYSVIKLDPSCPTPSTPPAADFWSLSKSYDELSLVCLTNQAPKAGILERSEHWTAFRVAGTMEFTLTGIVAKISQVLADAGIGIFVISTFDTDFILVKHNDADSSVALWRKSGIEIVEPLHHTARLDFVDFDYELKDVANNNRAGKTWVEDYPSESDMMIANLSLQSPQESPRVIPALFALRSRSTGLAIGGIGFKGEHIDDDFRAMEIGYSLAQSERGKGFGTEAITGIITIARARGIEHLCAETVVPNIASQKALARHGFSERSRTDSGIWWELSILD